VASCFPELSSAARAMGRCECTQLAFREFARRLSQEGKSFEQVSRETGCGRLCTACIPDLQEYLRSQA
jgi:bacterioferritin-associated ferredoxin